MDLSINTSTPTRLAPLTDADTVVGTAKLNTTIGAATLQVISTKAEGQHDGPGQLHVRLEVPNIGAEDIPLEDFLAQLDKLDAAPTELAFATAALAALAEGADAVAKDLKALAGALQKGGKPSDQQIANLDTLSARTLTVEETLRNAIENSTYPQYSDFLKEMVALSQQLREAASKAKQAAVEGNFNMMMEAAHQMEIAAEKAKESRDKNIEAERLAAIGSICAGVLSIAGSIAGIKGGITLVGQFWQSAAQGAGQLLTGSLEIAGAQLKLQGSKAQLDSDLANAAKERLEAAAKVIDAQGQLADDIKELAKSLRDMAIKTYQDAIAAQAQIIQHANI